MAGGALLQTQEADLTLSIKEVAKDDSVKTRAGSIQDKVLTRLRVTGRWMTRQELNADPLVGGSSQPSGSRSSG